MRLALALDSSVILSGLYKPAGLAGKLLQPWINQAAYILVFSQYIVDEVLDHAGRLALAQEDASDFFALATDSNSRQTAGKYGVYRLAQIRGEDEGDNPILATALEGRADYLVSYDSGLLSLKHFQGIQIVHPTLMLRILTEAHTVKSEG